MNENARHEWMRVASCESSCNEFHLNLIFLLGALGYSRSRRLLSLLDVCQRFMFMPRVSHVVALALIMFMCVCGGKLSKQSTQMSVFPAMQIKPNKSRKKKKWTSVAINWQDMSNFWGLSTLLDIKRAMDSIGGCSLQFLLGNATFNFHLHWARIDGLNSTLAGQQIIC